MVFFDDEKWNSLLGISIYDNFGFEDNFWTDKAEYNPHNSKDIDTMVYSSTELTGSFKLSAFFNLPITKILIIT